MLPKTSVIDMVARSKVEPARAAAKAPTPKPTISDSSRLAAARTTVLTNFGNTRWLTGTLVAIDMPKSPFSTVVSHLTYWTRMG